MTLFEIGDELRAVEAVLDGSDDCSEAKSLVDEYLDCIRHEEFEKLDAYCRLIKALEVEADACADEIERIRKRKNAADLKVKWLRQNLLAHLEKTDRAKIRTAIHTLSVSSNGKRALVLHVDTDMLPEQFVRIKKEPDTEAIRSALNSDDGAIRSEAEKYARVAEAKPTLRIF